MSMNVLVYNVLQLPDAWINEYTAVYGIYKSLIIMRNVIFKSFHCYLYMAALGLATRGSWRPHFGDASLLFDIIPSFSEGNNVFHSCTGSQC